MPPGSAEQAMNERKREREKIDFSSTIFYVYSHTNTLTIYIIYSSTTHRIAIAALHAWYRRFSLEGGYKAIIPSQLIPSVF